MTSCPGVQIFLSNVRRPGGSTLTLKPRLCLCRSSWIQDLLSLTQMNLNLSSTCRPPVVCPPVVHLSSTRRHQETADLQRQGDRGGD
ncbi:hypothetical protein INR49_011550 [Caranx melampygus]|nr:hypothetical protein INR49_011550 [Caranx melampygus]